MMGISCELLLLMSATSGAAAFGVVPLAARGPAHGAFGIRAAIRLDASAAGGGDDDGAAGGGELSTESLLKLRQRILNIQQNGLASPSQKLFDLAMSKSPQTLMQEFFRTSPPEVVQAMQDAVASLLGSLPPFEFDAQMTTTGDKLAALMLQLQMTGYMLRNAEYVMTVRRLLKLKSRSMEEFRAAFDRVDLDKSGFIENSEVEQLLREVYEDVPPFEVATFVELFDTDGDGRISWDEFITGLGGNTDGTNADLSSLPLIAGSDGPGGPEPKLSGTVTVEMDDGSKVEMDASSYMEQLKAEASALRNELAQAEQAKVKEELALSTSISAYVSSLPDAQLKLLTSGISDDVVAAMKQLVTFILRAPDGEGPLAKDAEVTLEQAKLQQLCLYQLILGYRLREAEATGSADEQIGR